MSATAPLFDDLPVPKPRKRRFVPTYRPNNPAMRAALQFAMALADTSAADREKRQEYYRKMVAAIMAKDRPMGVVK